MKFKLISLEATNILAHAINKFNNIDEFNQVDTVRAVIRELLNATRNFAEEEKCFVSMDQFYDIVKVEVKETVITDIIYDIYMKELPLVISPFSNIHETLGTVIDWTENAYQPHYWIKVINNYLEKIHSSTFIDLTLDNLTAVGVSSDMSKIQPVAVDKDLFHGLLNEAVKAVVSEDDMPKHVNSPIILELAFKQSVSMLFDEFLPSNSHSAEITEGMKTLEEQLKPFIDLGIALRSRNQSRGMNYGRRYIDERPTRNYGDGRNPNPIPLRFGPTTYGRSGYRNTAPAFWNVDPSNARVNNDIVEYLEYLKADVENVLATIKEEGASDIKYNRNVNSLMDSCYSVMEWYARRQ